MTNYKMLKALKNCADGEEFPVSLKNGDDVMCRANPRKTSVEAAVETAGSCEVYRVGDVIKAKEIASF